MINNPTQAPSSSNKINIVVLTAQPCSCSLRLYSCTYSSRFLPRSKIRPLFFNGKSLTVKSPSSLNLFVRPSSKYSSLNLHAILLLTAYLNFYENRLAAVEAPISTAVYAIQLATLANKLIASFLFKSWHFLAGFI